MIDAREALAVAEEAARAAGALLLPRFGSERALASKSSPTDLVSEADLAAERAIRDVLAARRPDDGVLGEEGTGDVAGTTGLRWIVDPIDGTINFLYGIPQWCVSVAVADGEGSVAGVVLDPVRGELFAVARGGAATVDGRALERTPDAPSSLGEALVGTGFSYVADERAVQAEVVRELLPRVRDLRRAGSAALDLCWCAAGRLDAYFEFGVKPWDIAAGALLCSVAGLEVRELPPAGGLPLGILAAPASLADELQALAMRRSA